MVRWSGWTLGACCSTPAAVVAGVLLRRRGGPYARAVPRPGAAAAAGAPAAGRPSGPRAAYRCTFNVNTDAFTGADGTASAIGWLGDHNSVVTCLGGTFLVQDGPGGLFQDDGLRHLRRASARPGPTPAATSRPR